MNIGHAVLNIKFLYNLIYNFADLVIMAGYHGPKAISSVQSARKRLANMSKVLQACNREVLIGIQYSTGVSKSDF